MNRFRLKKYHISNKKILGDAVRILFLSDLHGISFGTDNRKLLAVIEKRKPDLILIGGDMVVGRDEQTADLARKLTEDCLGIAPVCYALGNHEQKLRGEWGRGLEARGEAFFAFLKEEDLLLDNSSRILHLKGNEIVVHGLTLEKKYYKKPFPQKLTAEVIASHVGNCGGEGFHLLLSHNPYHGRAYFSWGADMTLAGHYHGGVVRFGENYGLVSTHFHLFPSYCCGKFQQGEQTMIVSGGLGEHSVPMRFHNPRELIEINLSR